MINKLKGDERGLTLTEVIIALVLFAVVGSSVMFALNASSKTIISAHEITTAESLTRTVTEYIKRSDYDTTVIKSEISGGDISATDTTILLDDASGFPAATTDDPRIIQIEEELIQYTGKSGDSLIGCQRGYFRTTAAEHDSGTVVMASPLYYDDTVPNNNICLEAGIDLAGDPYFNDYKVETGILRLECQYPDKDTAAYTDDDGLQKIYVLVRYQGLETLTTESYKVIR